MATLERASSFVQSFIKDDEGELGIIYDKARTDAVPVIRKETRELLKTQLLILRPENILEVGTAVGYSALYMLECLNNKAKITTLEISEDRIRDARNNIESLRKCDFIEVVPGDAMETLKKLPDEAYEFVFLDAAKAQYINYLPELLRVVKHGGVIFTDNILQEGEILESHFTVDKRNRTIHDRMREYLLAITTDKRLETAILSVADGVAISYVK